MPVYKLTYNAIVSIEVFANTWEGAIEKGEHILNDDVMIAKYHLSGFKSLGEKNCRCCPSCGC